MAHPFASSEHSIYPTHVYAEPTMIGVFPMNNSRWSTAPLRRNTQLSINNEVSPMSSEETLSPMDADRTWWLCARPSIGRDCKRRVAYISTALILFFLWTGIIVCFARDDVSNQENNDRPTKFSLNEDSHAIMLQGNLKTFEPSTRTLTVNWSPLISTSDGPQEPGSSDDTKREIGIYRDQVAILDTNHTAALGWDSVLRRVDNSSVPAIAVVGQHPWDGFSTDIDFQQAKPIDASRKPMLDYPFDEWSGSIVFVANDREWARNAGDDGSYVVPINEVSLVGSSLNWKITAKSNNTCNDASATSCAMIIEFTATRTGLVKFATIIAVLINWIITIFILIMTCEGVILHRRGVIHDASLLAVCFTALFALPSIRSILPGAPDFGAMIDFVGIMPNIITIAVCTMMLAVSSLRHFVKRCPSQDDGKLQSPAGDCKGIPPQCYTV